MTKKEIDDYFTANWKDIQKAIKTNAPKCATVNHTDISSDIYLICVEKADRINNLSGFIRILASNIYRWESSPFNRINRIESNTMTNFDTYIDEPTECDEMHQSRLYALQAYQMNALPHELIFYDLYINKGVRSVRGLEKHLNTTFRGAQMLIKDFKLKIKEYERKAKIGEETSTSNGSERSERREAKENN